MKFRKTAAGILALLLLTVLLPFSLFSCGEAVVSEALNYAVDAANEALGGSSDEIVIYTTPDETRSPETEAAEGPAAEGPAVEGQGGEAPAPEEPAPEEPAPEAPAPEAEAKPGDGPAEPEPEAPPAEQEPEAPAPEPEPEPEAPKIDEGGTYDDKESVALYLHTYGKLPSNYITKKEAEALGWTGGSLERYAPGKCIGGTYFGNYEGLLPKKKGREYHECDIGTLGKSSRGAKRIVYSNDGLIYYTGDHYESFELLYGEE